jgi:hypothetical protein
MAKGLVAQGFASGAVFSDHLTQAIYSEPLDFLNVAF